MIASDYIVLSALLAASLTTAIVMFVRQGRARATAGDADAPAVFLFEDQEIRDMTPAARDILPPDARTRDDVEEFLSVAFPNLLLQAIGPERVDRVGRHPGWHLIAETRNGILRVEVRGMRDLAMTRHARDLALLDAISAHAPQLIWQQASSGRVIWSNAAYRTTVASLPQCDGVLFPGLARSREVSAMRLQPDGCDKRWFDVTTALSEGRLTCFATETTALVSADENRREYVNTLGRTFGDLSTGLAIFDKDRQLKMFNPALLEMSKLPFAFLSTRPRIDTVFDRMRELQMMPEPKDYTTWREQFIAVETGARQGTYCENWPLPDGQTFRVTGRPHPDGAFALLFEDITAELSLTRRFRTEIETSQAVLDSLPDALAVFTHTGTLVMTNAAYATLWGDDPQSLAHRSMSTEVETWRERTVDTPVWREFLGNGRHISDCKGWSRDVLMTDGRPLRCDASSLGGGMTLVRFSLQNIPSPIIRKLTQPDPAIRIRGG